MKKIFYISLISLSFGMISCEDNLDITPTYILNEKNAVTNDIQARSVVNGIYQTIVESDEFSGKLYSALASKSGFFLSSTGDYEMIYSESNETTTNITNRWLDYYTTLNAANFAITKIEQLSETQIEDEDKTTLLAEAKCLRAFANMNLFWNYGHWWSTDDSNPNGILYRDKPITAETIEGARLNVGDSYQKIFDDLDFAINNLPSFTSSKFVSKQFAKVLKAKILLYRNGFNDGAGDFAEALTLVNDVLNNGVAGFSMQPDLAKVYEDSWDSEENLFSGYISDNADRVNNVSYFYSFSLIMSHSNRLPLFTGQQLDAGLNAGFDWFSEDPRWDIVTGKARAPILWDKVERFTFTKVARLGKLAGQEASPQDLKFNTYFFRYPELYILKAELLARTGASITEAIAPINEMRSKRTNPVLPSLNPQNEQELKDMIFKEYFLETFLENGSEYFASLRFKDNAGLLWIESFRNGTPISFNRLCYPIPSQEMELNSKMTQNTDLE
ncbi:RagB/SusD family nutrient uptake outer membrane protein [Tamlana haliotis]|uniref:RagB/SusD family nutrient uptake outer membrane protein n=1 Tax=Pseudotamlana haliotis TaxID=2614804 RepID=A0A6N6MBY1_9FLAO|nr:RagB/SusD family nutrient uptake outer membrane protein [Tamlana haliotis]KAB1067716.1 RagB/SusD family nutrient uptake outer membrane protein [Tamlana haliotis]